MNDLMLSEETALDVNIQREESFMSTSELAEALDVGESTVKRAVEELRPVLGGLSRNKQGGYLFTETQATQIKQEIQKHHNLSSRQIDKVSTEQEENQMIAQAFTILQRRLTEAQKEVEKLKPAAAFAYQLCSSKDAIDIGNCAKVLNRNIGRNRLFELLRNKKILQPDNIPYQKYIDAGYFRVIETKYVIPSGETKISLKTLVLQKGVAYINKLLKEAVND